MKVNYDGHIVEVQDGISLYDFSVDRDVNDAILARVDGELQELPKPLMDGTQISFLTLQDLPGYESMRRSASMMLMKSIDDVLGSPQRVVLHFSISSGLFYTIDGVSCDDAFAAEVEEAMRSLVKREVPFRKQNMKTKEARRILRERGMADKDKLFRFRRSSRTNMYDLDGYMDYYYGYMVPHTGYVKHFHVLAYHEGLVLQLPKRNDTETVPPFEPFEKLFAAQIDGERWSSVIGIENIADLNEKVTEGSMRDPVLQAEAMHEAKIADIAKMVLSRNEVKFILIAGPSSSGKTTFSQRLCIQLATHGMKPHYLGVDNYFLSREDTPLDENGRKDYESLRAIDVDQFGKDMQVLLDGGTIQVPTFNFAEGKREYHGGTLSLPEGDILVIEGIHCLNDDFSYMLPEETKFRIYLSALAQINIDDHDRLPTTDGRLLRRMARDNRTRGLTAANTIDMWESVRAGEEKNIFPYQEKADVFFNSALPYELAVLKPYVQPLLFQIREEDPEYDEARRLLKFLDYVVAVPADIVPDNSILREFIGNGCFHL